MAVLAYFVLKLTSYRMRKIRLWALDGAMGSGIGGLLDVLTVANTIWAQQHHAGRKKVAPLFDWRVESFTGAPLRTPSGLTLQADGAINPRAEADVVLIPRP